MCSFIHFPLISFISSPNIPRDSLFWNNRSLCSTPRSETKFHASINKPVKYILIFMIHGFKHEQRRRILRWTFLSLPQFPPSGCIVWTYLFCITVYIPIFETLLLVISGRASVRLKRPLMWQCRSSMTSDFPCQLPFHRRSLLNLV